MEVGVVRRDGRPTFSVISMIQSNEPINQLIDASISQNQLFVNQLHKYNTVTYMVICIKQRLP